MTVWDAQVSVLVYGKPLLFTLQYYGRQMHENDYDPEYGESFNTLVVPFSSDPDKLVAVNDIIDKLACSHVRNQSGIHTDGIMFYSSLIMPYVTPTLHHIRLKHDYSDPMVTSESSDSILTAELNGHTMLKMLMRIMFKKW